VSTAFATSFCIVAAVWAVILLVGMVAIRRRGMEGSLSLLIPGLDLAGMWIGTIAVLLLAFGRLGFQAMWAGALFSCAFGITAGLYDRAVLVPSLRAAQKRRRADPDNPKWAEEWSFLARLGGGTRVVTLLCVIAAIACIAMIP